VRRRDTIAQRGSYRQMLIRPQSKHPMDTLDIATLLFIVVPIAVSAHSNSATFLPDATFAFSASWRSSPEISLLRQCALTLCLCCFFIFRPHSLSQIGFRWSKMNIRSVSWSILRFLCVLFVFLSVAVPFCVGVDYLSAPDFDGAVGSDGVVRFLCLFLLEALPFEFVFRGVVQNLTHSALAFRVESASFLRGGGANSLTEILNHFGDDDIDIDGDAVLKSSNGRARIKLMDSAQLSEKSKSDSASPRLGVDAYDDSVDVSNLPYSENGVDALSMGASTMRLMARSAKRSSKATLRRFQCVRFDNARDYFALVCASLFYAFAMIDYAKAERAEDAVLGGLFLFWFGFCCGWLFRITDSCAVSALFSALVLFNFKFVFNNESEGGFCNGAC